MSSATPTLVGLIGTLTSPSDPNHIGLEVRTLIESLSREEETSGDNVIVLHGGRNTGSVPSTLGYLSDSGLRGLRKIAFPPMSTIDEKVPFNSYQFFVRNKQIINSADYVIFLADPNRAREAEVDPAIEYCTDIGKRHYILEI